MVALRATMSAIVFLLLLMLHTCAHGDPSSTDALSRLHAYLRIRTDHGRPGGPDYAGASTFLNATISSLLPTATVRELTFKPGKPITLATIAGSDPSLSSILLNSHTDVVPAEAEKWAEGDPFSPTSRPDGRLYARGAQDMKSIGMQYIEALSLLIRTGWAPKRTVHVSFVPDEEIGGFDGMGELVASDVWPSLNVGLAVDEGAPNPGARFNVYVGERQTWWVVVTVTGAPGHGATFPKMTAAQRLHEIVGRALAFREEQRRGLEEGMDIGDVIGLNVPFLEAGNPDANHASGYVSNMIPSVARAGFDIRIPPGVSPEVMDEEISKWMSCGEAICEGVKVEFTNKVKIPYTTGLHPSSGEWYVKAFYDGLNESGIDQKDIDIGIFYAATDARFARKMDIPAIGFSPIQNTPNLLHKHDEYILTDGYIKGIGIYQKLIKSLAGTEDQEKSEL